MNLKIIAELQKEQGMPTYEYCPMCRMTLHHIEGGLTVCPSCSFKQYNNPVPVVACLVPYDNGLVLVQRGVKPFIGEWCLPCGFINAHEDVARACRREVLEETGLEVRLEKIISGRSARPSANQLILYCLTSPVGGVLAHGDDAMAVDVFHNDKLPKICFPSHGQVIADYFQSSLVLH